MRLVKRLDVDLAGVIQSFQTVVLGELDDSCLLLLLFLGTVLVGAVVF